MKFHYDSVLLKFLLFVLMNTVVSLIQGRAVLSFD